MSMISKENVVWAIRKLHPRWRELLGDEAATAAESLVAVALEDGSDAAYAVELLKALFEEYDALGVVRYEIDVAELGDGESLYSPLTGRMRAVAVSSIAYCCPEEGCQIT